MASATASRSRPGSSTPSFLRAISAEVIFCASTASSPGVLTRWALAWMISRSSRAELSGLGMTRQRAVSALL